MDIFKLFGRIVLDNDEANQSIDDTSKKAGTLHEKLASGIKTVAKWGAAFTAGAGVAAGAILKVANNASQATDRVDKMSQKIGISRTAFQELDFICSQSGTSVDTLQMGIKTLTNQMQAASAGTASAVDIFDQLGLSIYDTNGRLKDQETMMWEAMSALQGMENQTEKAALANDLFGRSGSELMPLLNGATGSIEAMREQAHDLGLVLSDESVDAGVKYTDTMDQVKRSVSAIVTQFGVGFMPAIQQVLEWVLSNLPLIQSIFSTVFGVLKTVVSWFGTVFGSVFGSISNMLNNTGTTFEEVFGKISGLFKTLWEGIQTVWNSIGQPIWDIIQKCIGIVHDAFKKRMPAIKEFVSNCFSDIRDFWENNLKPCFDAIQAFIENVLAPAFEFVFSTVIGPAVDAAFKFIKDLWNNTLKPVFTGITDFLTGIFTLNFSKAFEGLVKIVKGIWDGIVNVVKTPINFVIGIINKFLGGLNKIKIPDWIPLVGGKGINIPLIPMLEKGGVLEKGQVGFLEGNGAEAVVPLDQNRAWISAVAKDMEISGIAGGNNHQMQEMKEAFDAFVRDLPEMLTEAFAAMKFDVNNREFARMVRAVN